ncbi:MAG: ISKra4 family transposase [Nitrospinae bacterium]|nr:ISKra4 family transposase [Nitrospinota bacterium]
MNRDEYLAACAARYDHCGYERTKKMKFTQLERMILEGHVELARMLLQSRLEDDPRGKAKGGHLCPKCKHALRFPEKHKWQRRILRTIMGELAYHRAYGLCDACGYTGAPLDEALAIPRRGPSVGALRKICHAAVVARSFEAARDMLRELAGMLFGRQHIRTVSEREGRRIVEERNEEVKAAQAGRGPQACASAPELLVIAADGGRVHTIQPAPDERWKEDRVGVVYDAVPRPDPEAKLGEYEGAKAQTKTYVASMEKWEPFGWMLWVEALRRGYEAAKQVLFLADGAKPIRDLKNLHFPNAIFILDFWHVVEHLAGSARAAFGEGTEAAIAARERWKRMLWNGNAEGIIRDIAEQSHRLGAPQKGDPESSPRVVLHRDAFSFFPNNKDAMDYPRYRTQGWPIGSGAAESGVKQLAKRVKGTEMHWNVSHTGAEEILALCALFNSEDGRWDQYWDRRAQGGPE